MDSEREKPWREQVWDEWCELWDCAIPNDRVDFARFREATYEKRAELDAEWQISVKATEKAIDALCARVWREAQASDLKRGVGQRDEVYQHGYDDGRIHAAQAAEARAARLAAALRHRMSPTFHGTYLPEGCDGCAAIRDALADSPKEETCWCGHGLSRHKENWPDGICFDCWPGKPHLYNLAVADSPKEQADGG